MQTNNIKKPIGLFFYDKSITYITYHQKQTTIFSNQAYTIFHSLTYVLNELLLPYLKTYDGYKKAYQKLFKQMSYIPIQLSSTCILLPMYGYRSQSNVLLNIFEIDTFQSNGYGCLVHMTNDQTIYVEKTCHSIKNHMKKALFNHNLIK